MQDPASELRRILLPRTLVNKARTSGAAAPTQRAPANKDALGSAVPPNRTSVPLERPRSQPLWQHHRELGEPLLWLARYLCEVTPRVSPPVYPGGRATARRAG
jgi:hypothetical protein